MTDIELLAVVALLKDIPEHRLVRGQVGTVVEILSSGVAEVEFSDEEGVHYAVLPLKSEDLIRLHHHPAGKVA